MKGHLPEKWDYETEVAVVGAGGAGLATAISAHDAGAQVLVVDRMQQPGGDTRISLGSVYAAGTSIQKALGVEDSADRMYKLYMATSPNADKAEAERMRIIADGSAEAIDWLIGLGVKFPAVFAIPGLKYGGIELLPEIAAQVPQVPGSHACEGRGEVMHDTLLRQARNRGIEILTEMRGREPIIDGQGEIIGIKAEARGKTLYIKANRSVVICSGHFAHNRELMELYIPEFADLRTFTAPGLEGDGLIMAQALGAAVGNISDCRIVVGSWYEPDGSSIQMGRWYPCILVNKRGKRFINDHAGYGFLARAVYEQPDGVCFVIFDEAVRKSNPGNILYHPAISPDLSREIEEGLVKTALTIRVLAMEIGADPGGLETTLVTYNENAKSGKDPEFGSVHFVEPINNPPFYAVKCVPMRGAPSGGLRTNGEAQVLDVFGKVIPRLYAVGSVTCLYKEYPGGGSSLANVFVFGRIAGKNAAREPLR